MMLDNLYAAQYIDDLIKEIAVKFTLIVVLDEPENVVDNLIAMLLGNLCNTSVKLLHMGKRSITNLAKGRGCEGHDIHLLIVG
jgi:hypothetical protein